MYAESRCPYLESAGMTSGVPRNPVEIFPLTLSTSAANLLATAVRSATGAISSSIAIAQPVAVSETSLLHFAHADFAT